MSKSMMKKSIKLNIQIDGLNDIKALAEDVVKKADELQGAIQRLNEVELTLETKFADQ